MCEGRAEVDMRHREMGGLCRQEEVLYRWKTEVYHEHLRAGHARGPWNSTLAGATI
jgi:hypothetical protein